MSLSLKKLSRKFFKPWGVFKLIFSAVLMAQEFLCFYLKYNESSNDSFDARVLKH